MSFNYSGYVFCFREEEPIFEKDCLREKCLDYIENLGNCRVPYYLKADEETPKYKKIRVPLFESRCRELKEKTGDKTMDKALQRAVHHYINCPHLSL